MINAGIKILISPSGAEEWDGKSELSHHQLREVEIEDLLPKEKIEVDLEAIGAMLRGKPILITCNKNRLTSKHSPNSLQINLYLLFWKKIFYFYFS